MSELRWNPLLEEWVITATHRQERTFFPPRDYCPLCPTRPGAFPTEIPAPDYQIAVFENKFPSLQRKPPAPSLADDDFYPIRPAAGVCEVVCYTSNHDVEMADLPLNKIENLIAVWVDRFVELGARDDVSYILIFENKGKEIGVTLSHPHGQIYSYPFVPPIPAKELEAANRHHEKTGRCLICDIMGRELADAKRIVYENEGFVIYVPFFARYPYETHLVARNHQPSLASLSIKEQHHLAVALKTITTKYNHLWGFSLPYMMLMHQAPTDGKHYEGAHLHIEFQPPYRTPDKLKYLAGSEAGAGVFIVDTHAEDTAATLRKSEPQSLLPIDR
ncbi:MAG: galactose-1-phosphate uridylyltransferase [Armatimonadetes bacterium]|nr:galactose-1-phosphate uridylyltransferase [Armatimonadota bacterium]